MATRTRLQLVQAIADELGLRVSGTLTAVTTAIATAANYPFRTGRTNASSKVFEGDEFYFTDGQFTPNPQEIAAFVASTGVFTPGGAWTDGGTDPTTFDVYTKGIRMAEIQAALNKALRRLMYPTIAPITLVTDGDMETSGTGSWTATSSTHTKVTNANAIRQGQASRVLATAATGRIQSGTIVVDPTADRSRYYLQATVRAAVGTARLTAYDVTNSAAIESDDWTYQGWGVLGFEFDLPSTCEQLAVRLISVADADDSYWDDVILIPQELDVISLPSWVLGPHQIKRIMAGRVISDGDPEAYNLNLIAEVIGWHIQPDVSNPNSQYRLVLPYSMGRALYIDGGRYYNRMTADTDTVVLDDAADGMWERLIIMLASVDVCDVLRKRGPGQDSLVWENRYAEYRRRAGRLLTNPRYGMAPEVRLAFREAV